MGFHTSGACRSTGRTRPAIAAAPRRLNASHTNLGWMNTLRFGRLTLFAHLNARIGGYAYNAIRRRLLREGLADEVDQSGKPEELKKPVEYYNSWSVPGDHVAESSGFLKLRTVSLTYQLNPTQLNSLGMGGLGMSSLRLGFVARDLLTLTGYTSSDPEGSLNLLTRQSSGGES